MYGSGALALAGGLSLLTGVQPKVGAALVTTFLLGVSPAMHDFWNAEDQNQRMMDQVNFLKNVALVGATLIIMSRREPWPLSLAAAEPARTDVQRRSAA